MKQYCVILLCILHFSSCQRDEVVESQENLLISRKEVLWMTKVVDDNATTKVVGMRAKYWKPGDTVRIKFLNGEEALQQKVIENAAIWLQYANLCFQYVGVNEDADVKIGFDMDERWLAWSTIGTDCKSVLQNEPSLNFVWLADEGDEGVRAEVLRGFGHILGLGFEHRNPDSPVRFKPTADIAGEYNLSEQEVEEFKQQYTSGITDNTDYDKNSIMIVTIPRSFVVTPNLATLRNANLSDKDKKFITGIYPPLAITLKVYGNSADIYLCASKWAPVPGSHARVVDWGDGNTEKLEKDQDYYHAYGSRDEHTVRFYGADSLYRLFYSRRRATAIDVSKARKLETLYCEFGGLTELDLSNNSELTLLSVWKNELRTLDLSHNPRITQVTCSENQLTSIDLSSNDSLGVIWCDHNNLTSLDLSYNKGLVRFYCEKNQLSSLYLGDMPLLETVVCDTNNLSSISMGNCPVLWRLECRENDLRNLDLIKMPEIRWLFVSGNYNLNLMNVVANLPDRTSKGRGIIEVNPEDKSGIESDCDSKEWSVTVPGIRYRLRNVQPDTRMIRPLPGVDDPAIY